MFIIPSQLCDRSTDPKWNESFYFLIHDPRRQMLVAKARQFLYLLILLGTLYIWLIMPSHLIALQLSSGWDQPMGSLVITLKELLAAPQLVLDRWFPLDGASPNSQILLRAELKVMTCIKLF